MEIENIHNLSDCINIQRGKYEKIREVVKDLTFNAVDATGSYSCVSYKAIDGGKMRIEFNPFEIDYVDVADSFGNSLLKFMTPKGFKLESTDFKFLNDIPQVQTLLKILNKKCVTEISEILNNPGTAMDIAEIACIFHRISNNPSKEPFIMMQDGLLRTKALKAELIPCLIDELNKNKECKLVGVSKTSKLLTMLTSALHIEKVFPSDGAGFIEIPPKIEMMAYTWTGSGKIQENTEHLDYSMGKLYVGKLSHKSNLLVTIELPHDFKNGQVVYSRDEIYEIVSHLIKDSMYSYPNLGYPQTIMRAHEKAVQIGFTASVFRDIVMEKFLVNMDQSMREYIRDHRMINEIVDKGVLGGGM